jgi:hypothetical protein
VHAKESVCAFVRTGRSCVSARQSNPGAPPDNNFIAVTVFAPGVDPENPPQLILIVPDVWKVDPFCVVPSLPRLGSLANANDREGACCFIGNKIFWETEAKCLDSENIAVKTLNDLVHR